MARRPKPLQLGSDCEPSGRVPGDDLDELGELASYEVSPYHINPLQGKKMGYESKPRQKAASYCPIDLGVPCRDLSGWVKTAFARGNVSTRRSKGRFPDVLWYEHEGVLFEGRITNPEKGVYHGYPLEPGTGPDLK